MSIEPVKTEVQNCLHVVNEKLREAEEALAKGALHEKCGAPAELGFLKRREQELETRLHELEGCSPATADALLRWVRDDMMILNNRVDEWGVRLTSIEPVKTEVENRRHVVNEKLREAEEALAEGALHEKCGAPAELGFLMRREQELEPRLHELEGCPPATLDAVLRWVRDDMTMLSNRVEEWLARNR